MPMPSAPVPDGVEHHHRQHEAQAESRLNLPFGAAGAVSTMALIFP